MNREQMNQAIKLIKQMSQEQKKNDELNDCIYWLNVAKELEYYRERKYGKKVN